MNRRTLMVAVLLGVSAGMLVDLPEANAATAQPFSPDAFTAAQTAGKPILVFVEASWCPTCAKERPILAKLYEQPEFAGLQVFTVDFDKDKAALRQFNVAMQSTLIAFHGAAEKARATGATDPDVIQRIVAAANG